MASQAATAEPWSLSQPPAAIFGIDKTLPVEPSPFPRSDTANPSSELDVDTSSASTPLPIRRSFSGPRAVRQGYLARKPSGQRRSTVSATG